jgi:diguanylate cyclase (GGDEF)-like protein/PAS domain S-box-containing protein
MKQASSVKLDQKPFGGDRHGPMRETAWSRLRLRAPALLVLVLALGITAVAWQSVRQASAGRAEQELSFLAREIADHVDQTMSGFEQALLASRAYLQATPVIDREQWLVFQVSQRLDATGMLGIGLAEVLKQGETAAYVRRIRAREMENYHIWPEGGRDAYAPIRFTAALNTDTRALGFDMYSERNRREAMERARDTGNAVLSRVISLVRALDGEPALATLLYLPVYRTPLPANAPVEARRAALASYVYTPLIVGEFLDATHNEVARRKLLARITGPGGETLYQSGGFDSASVDLRLVHDMQVYGQAWKIELRGLPGLVAASGGGRSALVGAGGVTIALLLFGILWTVTSTGIRADTLAQKMTRELRESEGRFKSLTELSADWYWEQDENYRFTSQSGGGDGWSSSAIVNVRGKTRWELKVVGMTEDDWRAHRAVLDARLPYQDFRFKRYDDSGVLRHISVSGEPVFDDQGRFKGYRGIGKDITASVLAEEKVQYLAYHDNLTGLSNRSSFSLLLSHAIDRAFSRDACLGLLFVDLDRFKVINDTLGHDAGDALLREVAARLRKTVRANDTVARWGGDEFVVLLEDIEAPENAARVADKLLAELARATQAVGNAFRVTPSVGISIYPRDGLDEHTLIKNADLAMYQAKEQGRNNYQFYVPQLNDEAAQRLKLETSLRDALERSEFVLHYQPKVDLVDGYISGVEALLRWQPPSQDMVSPAQFIPLLESTGLIVRVGEWVLRSACSQIQAWTAAGIKPCPIAVNISARQLEQRDFVERTKGIIAEHGIDASLLKLEITESMLMRRPDEAVTILRRLAGLGVKLSVDDFGTGYSSFSYLKRFPLNELKIDRSFVQDVIDPDSAAIALAIIELAHNLQLKVVAEGVETREQLLFLRTHGCDEMQGFFFAKPMAAEECTGFMGTQGRLDLAALADVEGTRSLLLVDDSAADLGLMQRALAPLGHPILLARTARDALHQLARHNVAVVISDQNMPGTRGVALMGSVRTLYPKAVRILASGVGTTDILAEGINTAGVHKYLDKNWAPERIRAEVHEAIQRYQAPA